MIRTSTHRKDNVQRETPKRQSSECSQPYFDMNTQPLRLSWNIVLWCELPSLGSFLKNGSPSDQCSHQLWICWILYYSLVWSFSDFSYIKEQSGCSLKWSLQSSITLEFCQQLLHRLKIYAYSCVIVFINFCTIHFSANIYWAFTMWQPWVRY